MVTQPLIGGFALNLAQGVVGNSKNLVLDFINQPTSLAGNFTGINDLTSKGDVLISGEHHDIRQPVV